MQLSDFIGQVILVMIPFLDKSGIQKVKLLGVESGGIWIQSQHATNFILQKGGLATSPKTPVFFSPYHAISLAYAATEEPALNEVSFGV